MNNKNIKYALFLMGILIPILIEKFYYPQEMFSIDRFIVYTSIIEFIFINFIYDRKKLWDYIYKYRYVIGIIIFSFIVINGYHTSSLGLYNDIVQPNIDIQSGTPIIGEDRTIRSDEWLVSSMNILSQGASNNNFNDYNSLMMGDGSYVNFYPKFPTKSFYVITTPQFLGFCFLPIVQGYSFYTYFIIFFTFFASFEFFMLITKKNKLWSLTGALLLTFAPAVQWWDQQIIIPSGMTAVLLINKFLNEESRIKKILLSILVGWMGSIYFMSFYPAFMIPYFYFYLGVFIWVLHENKGKYKLHDLIMLVIITLLTVALLIIPTYIQSKDIFEVMSNTVYPGARFSTGGYYWTHLFNYVVSVFLPFIVFGNACEASQFISFYPIPIIIGITYIYNNYKKKKMDLLLIIMILVIFLLSIWNYVELPRFLARISLLYMSTPERCQLIVGFVCTVLLVYCMANYSTKNIKSKYWKFILSFIVAAFAVYINKVEYDTEIRSKVIIVSLILFTSLNYLLTLNSQKTNTILAIILSILALVSGITVHPFNKGLGVVYDKPVSKEIRSIVKQNPEAIWLSATDSVIFSNYSLANGARMINSTNYYPNISLWNKIDKNKKYEDVWNRYAHIAVVLTNEKTSVELLQEDMIKVNLNVNSICDLNVEYMISNMSTLEEFSNDKITIDNIYTEDNMYIYKNTCH